MKNIYAMAMLIGGIVFTPLVQAGVGLNQVGPGGISAVITPEAGESGTKFVFMGAIWNGHLYLRGPGTANWIDYTGGSFPIAGQVNLSSGPVNVTVTDFDISILHGADVYVGYGTSQFELLLSGHLAKIYTVP